MASPSPAAAASGHGLAALFRTHATELAPALLGCHLEVRTAEGAVLVRLTEVEAYGNQGEDPGAHSFRGKTRRNASLFGPPQHTYVYLNYGIHRCLNLACDDEGTAGGVLLRAAEVVEGRDLAVARRGGKDTGAKLLSGPGRLGQGLGITLGDDAQPILLNGGIHTEQPTPRGAAGGICAGTASEPEEPAARPTVPAVFTLHPSEVRDETQVRSGPRVGVSGPGGHAEYSWRFWLDGDPSVSPYRAAKPRKSPRIRPSP